MQELVREILEGNGYTVLEARHGEEAVTLCRGYEGRIDLLLTDVVMPRMRCRELAGRVAPDRPEMRVLFMSGYTALSADGDGALCRRGLRSEAVHRGDLAQRIRDLLDELVRSARSAA